MSVSATQGDHKKKKEERKIETTAAKYNGLPILWAAVNSVVERKNKDKYIM